MKWGFFSCLDAQNGLTCRKFPAQGSDLYSGCGQTKQAGSNRALVGAFLVAALFKRFQKAVTIKS
jgi:hypothetical protein